MYSKTVMDHFQNPRHVGEIADADGTGEVGNVTCGDMMAFTIKVKDDRLADVKFRTFGCGAAIAVSSMVSEMAIGKTLDEAMNISNRDVADELGGLPKHKHHCSNLGADALHKAIEDYRSKAEARDAGHSPVSSDKRAEESETPATDVHECRCPFCDHEVGDNDELCKPCGKKISHCTGCGAALPAGQQLCSSCLKGNGEGGPDEQ
mgnify:CR=1 FL=1